VPIPKQKSKNPTTADFRLIIVQDFKEESQLLGHFLWLLRVGCSS